MKCTVCKRDRNTVTPKNSSLMPSIRLFLCNECLDNKREPRYLIVLTGRAGDAKKIAPYLEHHRYIGETITAKEIYV